MNSTQARIALMGAVLAGLAWTSGCSNHGGFPNGHGGGSGSATGTVSAAVTDAASDEIESFVVDVSGLILVNQGGAQVSVLSSPVTLDLASLTDTTALLNHVNVPVGIYTAATITLDFTPASCLLIGESTPAQILDTTGAAVTGTLSMPVQFGAVPLTVLANKHRLLEFDFDLNQSVSVDATANSVMLDPAFVLRVDGSGKKLATVGSLASVNVAASSFVGGIETLGGSMLGNVTYRSEANTIFHVDGVPAVGAVGLALLSSEPVGTWLEVQGQIDPNSSSIVAAFVEAGTGTYNGGKDIVEGHVIERLGNPSPGSNVVLRVLGRSNDASHTTIQLEQVFTVTTSFANTKVVRPFSAQTFDVDDVNVGQRVRIFGSLSGTTMLANQAGDVIREQVSRVFGQATGPIATSTLTLNVQHVDLRPENVFTWADGGTSAPDPTAFTANVGSLGNNLGIQNGTAVEVRGFIAPVGDGNQDLSAVTLINLDDAPSLLFVRNLPGGFTLSLTATATAIEIGISGTAGTGEKAILDHGYAGFVPLPSSPTPTLQPAGAAGLFMIRDKVTGMVTVYVTFDTFRAALSGALTAGANVASFGGMGAYTSSTNTIQAGLVCVILE